MNEIIIFFRGIVPTPIEYLVGGLASCLGTAFCYFIGGFDALLVALVYATAIDYVTGVTAAAMEKDKSKKPNSKRGLKGIIKKVFIFCLVGLAWQVDIITGDGVIIRSVTIWFFFGNEGLSILENVARIGLPVPKGLKNILAQLQEEQKEEKSK